uniref:uncharacterized protein LOC122578469 n=1 Tax=Erigeron canadensis TaxID=72917 RepID=UPI001CB9020E|nr:uncharacterized protein LOC122578469 [Erigeron canadensis]
MGKRRSPPILQKVSNLIKVSIFIAKMRLVYLKKSAKLKGLNHYNSYYKYIQERQFSPSSTPLISFRKRKSNGEASVYSVWFLSCFSGQHDDENYSSYDQSTTAIMKVEEKDGNYLELLYEGVEEDSVDERADKFIERFYEEMKRQRRESSSSSIS